MASLIVLPWGYAVAPLLAAGVALVGGMVTRDRGVRLDVEDALWLLALLSYAVVWLADVARTGVWPDGRGGHGVLLPLWPVLAAGLLVWLRRHPPALLGWWLGLIGGALGAGAIACYERLWLGDSRADNGMNAIPFGNLGLLLGVLALVAMLGLMSGALRRTAWLTGLLGLAAVAGLVTSMLSGTRGGWIALPLLGWLIFRTFHVMLPGKRLLIMIGLLGALMIGAVSLPQSGVLARVMVGVENLQRYFVDDVKGTPEGLRLEMWKAGVVLFAEKPLLGWGEGRLQAARDEMVAEGKLHLEVSWYEQLHSEVIDTAARRGLVGLLTLVGLYGIPLLLFTRHLRGTRSSRVRSLALSGVIICVSFIDFGLSQSMLRDARGLAGYLGLNVICWALLKNQIAARVSKYHSHDSWAVS
ncbi:O-antigen ligase family protein [Modicisalibacter muralis]|uniref:O-antigen ligase family protein n=1 Tax=Modicisalibacter muralis TaxID=119000 RepID=UPI000B7D60B9|nr:O-antigen ligase family protein [Halomonas muralis]